MNRRDAIKLSTLAALGVAVSAEACPIKGEVCNTKKCHTTQENKNRNQMSIKDPKHPTKAELKHTPQITLGKKDANGYTQINITVGQGAIIHPSTSAHWIDFIKLHADDKLVGISELMAEISRGATSFSVKLDGVKNLTATAGCNLHGVWSSTLKV
jgi:superoxide reductase